MWKADGCEGLRLSEGVVGAYQVGQQQQIMWVKHVCFGVGHSHNGILCQQHSKHSTCTLHTDMSIMTGAEKTSLVLLQLACDR